MLPKPALDFRKKSERHNKGHVACMLHAVCRLDTLYTAKKKPALPPVGLTNSIIQFYYFLQWLEIRKKEKNPIFHLVYVK